MSFTLGVVNALKSSKGKLISEDSRLELWWGGNYSCGTVARTQREKILHPIQPHRAAEDD